MSDEFVPDGPGSMWLLPPEDVGDGFDWRRFPHEVKAAVEASGEVMVDQLDPGLFARRDGDVVVVTVRDGREVARVPVGCLAALDLDRLEAYLREGGHESSKAAADVVRDHADRVVDDPRSTFVEVPTGPGRRYVVHRSAVVDGWPEDDHRDAITR
jgi:hypothetical protein